MKHKDDLDELMSAAKALAVKILENGGETYRAEDALRRLGGLCGSKEIEALALPTGVFVYISAQDGKTMSALARLHKRDLNLGELSKANDIARALEHGKITAADAAAALKVPRLEKRRCACFSAAFATAFSIGCFSVLMGGGAFEFFASSVCAFLSQLFCSCFKKGNMFFFASEFVGGSVCALGAVIFVSLFDAGSAEVIIGSSILPLLPGATLVSAMRDSVHGDLVSGAARLCDVIASSLSLAFGIGAVLWLCSLAGGVV